MKRWYKHLIIWVLLVVLFIQTPTFQWLKSITVMGVYSKYEEGHSLLTDKNIGINIPGGMATKERDWYPFVMTFNDDIGFSRYIGREVRMTVLYNFGYFSPWERQSIYYDESSPYYNSFYGAYAVSHASGEAFGYNDDMVDIEEMTDIATYDVTHLVLESIGSKNPKFEFTNINLKEAVLFEEEGWSVVDAEIKVSGSMHSYQKDYQAYIQYGRPPHKEVVEDYKMTDMYGRIYVKYYESQQTTIFFYCIAKEAFIIDDWEGAIMNQTTIMIQ